MFKIYIVLSAVLFSAASFAAAPVSTSIEIKILQEKVEDLEALVGDRFDLGYLTCSCEWKDGHSRYKAAAESCVEANLKAKEKCEKNNHLACQPAEWISSMYKMKQCTKIRGERFHTGN